MQLAFRSSHQADRWGKELRAFLMSNNSFDRIRNVGFQYVGRVVLSEYRKKGILFGVLKHEDTPRILYAFVSNKRVLYIGYTDRTLKRRMTAYTNRGKENSQEERCHNKAKAILARGEEIDIYALPDDELDSRGEFQINSAAGLEYSIIEKLQPPWNKIGKKKH